ncbi:single-stranded DNA-binding protein [Nesterenkonia alkaliphila]|uniref:Single-stranded DNA-binding protein n=1 Tax=Nesterenkonia alkaliphila TaxID=1463631 RepID=A0A7K1UGX6_9MICC|nr:single-stranded DNA-binding protein [Nesterenkonia alkaliphila]MVT25730.1 single-stranded DNA-binding protein [Nesterenkonia alkaliphila]GFZ85398.1 hypothetical protein GCM10011359_13170 [Nesterenkonia alkaliphila]
MPRGIEVTGRLTNDPQPFTSANGREMVGFRLADNNPYFDRNENKWKEAETEYYDVALDRDGLKENVLASLNKGDKVTVHGNLKADAYIDQQTGEARAQNKLWANEVTVGQPHRLSKAPLGAEAETAGPEAETERTAEQQAQLRQEQQAVAETEQARQQIQQAQQSWETINQQASGPDAGWER